MPQHSAPRSNTSPSPRDPQVPPYARGYAEFPGTVGRTTTQSTPWWPDPVRPAADAPNIVVVVVDDLGFSDIGPYGSEIATPHLDALADHGIQLTNYHTTPLCSPSRAALLTGVNPHRAGFGIVANSDPGYPGLRMSIPDDMQTMPEVLRDAGYATFAVGKWHLVRDSDLGGVATKDWPLQRGFDRYYGSLEGLNSFFHPNRLTVDNSPDERIDYPEDYYLTDDLTDRAIAMITDLRAHEADRPFFLYFAHVAVHGPLQAKDSDLSVQRGRYAEGWDAVRDRRFARQLARGLFPPGTVPAGRNTEPGFDVPAWAELSAHEQDRYARYMEVYAAMVSSIDQSLGRITAVLDELGERENTVIVFTSDNGATAEGGAEGTRSYLSRFVHSPVPADWCRDQPLPEELIGTEQMGVHYPRGWGQVSNTPFRLYKGHSFAGGIRVPFLISWPAGLPTGDASTDRLRNQYAYCTDVMPTLLDLAGVEAADTRYGLPVQERDGVSLSAMLADPDTPPARTEQYTEVFGQRGMYRDGWKLLSLHRPGTPVDRPVWQLFDTLADPCETTDLADSHPDMVEELARAWDRQAWHNTVFPLAEAGAAMSRDPRTDRALTAPFRILAGTPPLERFRSSRLIQYRDFRIDVELAGYSSGDAGVLLAHGDPMGGYLLLIEDGSLSLLFNAYGIVHTLDAGTVPVGSRKITMNAVATATVTWELSVAIDDRPVGDGLTVPQLIGMAPWTGISIGVDARGPVSGTLRRRRGVFPYTGALRAAVYTPGELKVPAPLIERIETHAEHSAD